jgi:hypothetical protein
MLPLKSNAQAAVDTTKHSPHRAAVMSALLPGAGQAYNKKYWKIPVIYAGFAGLAYAISFNQKEYRSYRNAYDQRLDADPYTIDPYVGTYSDADLGTLKDFYRRNRDLSIIGTGVLYLLNIIDASVDAHLYDFNVNDDLSIRLSPTLNHQMTPGIGMVITLK